MKVEFEFDAEDVTPMEGVAVISCFDPNGDPVVLYGSFGSPSSLAAVGMMTVGLQDAKGQFVEAGEYDG